MSCCWCWYVWCDCSMVLVDVCITHTCCFFPFSFRFLYVNVYVDFVFHFHWEKFLILSTLHSAYMCIDIFPLLYFWFCVYSIRVQINAISLLLFPSSYLLLLMVILWFFSAFFLFCFCRFPSLKFNLFNLSRCIIFVRYFSLSCSPTHIQTLAQYNEYCTYLYTYIFGTHLRYVNLNVIAKFLGITIICTKNSFDFSLCYLKTQCWTFLEKFYAVWLVLFLDNDCGTIDCKWPYWFKNRDREWTIMIEWKWAEESEKWVLHNDLFDKNRKCNEFDKLQCNALKNRNVLDSFLFSVITNSVSVAF